MILTLDIGTKLGVYLEEGKHSFTFDLGKGDERFINFYKHLTFQVVNNEVNYVIYEEAAFQRGNAIPIYHGLIGILKSVCMFSNVPFKGIPVGTIKKSFTGKGNCGKQEIMDKCDELGITYDDDNSADAYAVYHTYKELYDK